LRYPGEGPRSQSAAVAAKPVEQLPRGPYPASAATIWAIAVLTLLIGLTLAVLVPAALSSGDAPRETPGVQSSLGTDGPDGGNR